MSCHPHCRLMPAFGVDLGAERRHQRLLRLPGHAGARYGDRPLARHSCDLQQRRTGTRGQSSSGRGSSTSIWRSGSPCFGILAVWGRRHRGDLGGALRYLQFPTSRDRSRFSQICGVYLERLDHPDTDDAHVVMSDIFKDMIPDGLVTGPSGSMPPCAARKRGDPCGSAQRAPETASRATIERLMRDKAVAVAEKSGGPRTTRVSFPVSLEERLRGGDRKVEMCLVVESRCARPDAQKIAEALATSGISGHRDRVYRLRGAKLPPARRP